MKIAIIGTGNVGGALAKGWAYKGHEILLGVRNPQAFKGKENLEGIKNIQILPVAEAVAGAEVVVISTPAAKVKEVSGSLGDVTGKVIIDTMNSVFLKPDGFTNTADALIHVTQSADVIKCFNTTGFGNLLDPVYGGEAIDMFMAGSSEKGKAVARTLALDLGFENCYDLGGNEAFELIEKMALVWITLAMKQGLGRDIAFKLVKR